MMAVSDELLAFLAACRAAPADDMPRLVLADWLDEHDEPKRAELIRLQCELAHPTADTDRTRELKLAERELIRTHGERWLGTTPTVTYTNPSYRPNRSSNRQPPELTWTMPYEFSRGFIHSQGWHRMEEFLSYDVVRDWLRSPASAWLEQLQTQYPNLPAFQSASIPSELNGKIGLRLNASMSSNTSLYTSQTEVHTLTHATGLPTARDWRDFVQCPNFSMVRSFQCSGPSMIDFARELGATNLENLVELNLNSPTIGHQLAEIIGTTPFVGLSSLTLGPLNLEGIRALARSPFLGRLYRLNLTGSHFGDAGMKALVESPLADSLGHVSFPNKGLTDVSIEWLVNSPLFPRLQGTQLNLMMNQIGDAGLRILAESEKLMRFSELVLRENHIGNDGVAALADSPFAANLQYLDFWRNDIGDSGAIALADSPHLNKIVDLSLKENRLTTRGKDALSSRFGDRAKF